MANVTGAGRQSQVFTSQILSNDLIGASIISKLVGLSRREFPFVSKRCFQLVQIVMGEKIHEVCKRFFPEAALTPLAAIAPPLPVIRWGIDLLSRRIEKKPFAHPQSIFSMGMEHAQDDFSIRRVIMKPLIQARIPQVKLWLESDNALFSIPNLQPLVSELAKFFLAAGEDQWIVDYFSKPQRKRHYLDFAIDCILKECFTLYLLPHPDAPEVADYTQDKHSLPVERMKSTFYHGTLEGVGANIHRLDYQQVSKLFKLLYPRGQATFLIARGYWASFQYDRLLRVPPSRKGIFSLQIDVLIDTGKVDEAIKRIDQFQGDISEIMNARYTVAQHLIATQHPKAPECVETFRDHYPNSPLVQALEIYQGHITVTDLITLPEHKTFPYPDHPLTDDELVAPQSLALAHLFSAAVPDTAPHQLIAAINQLASAHRGAKQLFAKHIATIGLIRGLAHKDPSQDLNPYYEILISILREMDDETLALATLWIGLLRLGHLMLWVINNPLFSTKLKPHIAPNLQAMCHILLELNQGEKLNKLQLAGKYFSITQAITPFFPIIDALD
ncbi:MAG: hypothetical protein S4CHLAM102_08790 [Chlamydiia bacterium]|nr:hypothetical protein [Chlamydiia bacterium]